jgi:beta-glucosidase
MPFPTDFLWGAATSSYQIEGGVTADGRGESIWDRFSHSPGAVEGGDTGDVACDHFHRWADDVDLMAELGLRAYRFSIAWPRVLPEGRGRIEQRGIDFYRGLVDRLRERRMVPAATLYHWDLPQALQDRGGWANRETAEAFVEYADVMFDALGDDVPIWITHNEPWVAAVLGYLRGSHAPGITSLQQMLDASHHLLLSHGLAVGRYRALGLRGQVGITLNLSATYPRTDAAADRRAAHGAEQFVNHWYLRPVLRGSYPEHLSTVFREAGGDPTAAIRDGDLETIGRPIDFVGVNYYTRHVVHAADDEFGWALEEHPEPGIPTTQVGWEVFPQGLYDLLTGIRREYGPVPLYVTENGCALDDQIGPDGAVDDPARIDYLREHFAAAQRAIDDGVDLRGYFVWSLMDNFEWAMGYRPRFGLVYIDYPTERRIPKASAAWYRRIIEWNGLDALAAAGDEATVSPGD